MASLYIIVPFVLVLILNIPLLSRTRKWAAAAAFLYFAFQAVSSVGASAARWMPQADQWNTIFQLHLEADALSRLVLLLVAIVGACSLSVEMSMAKEDERGFYFVSLLLLAVAGMNGLVLVRGLFSIYVFVEVASIASFILIASDKSKDAFEGAFKYIMLSATASVMMLASIALLLLVSPDVVFGALRLSLPGAAPRMIVLLALGLFASAACIKSGVVPFHGWLADAYSAAPAPVSIFLAGIVTKAAGVYVLMRVALEIFAIAPSLYVVVLGIAIVSIVAGALLALAQSEMKRMLAYSSISQVGYILLGIGCGTPLGFAAATLHLFNHAIFKSLLFVNAAALENRLGHTDMEKMGGLGKGMPVTSVTSLLACLSTAGVPPLSGFWSKLLLVIALWASGHYKCAVIAVLASILTLGYMLAMQRRIFFGKVAGGLERIKEAGTGFVLPSLLLAALIVGVGAGFPFVAQRFLALFAGHAY